jgi:hypothetical protein
LRIFSLKNLPHIGEETVIGNHENGDPLHSSFEVSYPCRPDVCSVISYTPYPGYLFSVAENTVALKICYFYPLLLAPYQR